MKKHYQYLIGIAFVCVILSCSTQSKNTDYQSNSNTTESAAPHSKQDIDMNSILVEGKIISMESTYLFVVSKVIKRGRQAPTVLTNQKLLLEANNWTESQKDQSIKATLRCNQPREKNPLWTIIEVN